MSNIEKVGEAAILYVKFRIIVFALLMILVGISTIVAS